MSKGSKPKYIARAKQRDDNDYMQTIGAAWPFKEGEGLVVKLDLTPTNWNGDLVLVPPKEE